MILNKLKINFRLNTKSYFVYFIICFFIMYVILILFSIITASVNFERLYAGIIEYIQYTFELGKFDKN